MSTSFADEDMEISTESQGKSNNAGLSDHFRPKTKQHLSFASHDIEKSPSVKANNSKPPESASYSRGVLEMQRTMSPVASSNNTWKSSIDDSPIAVQGTHVDIQDLSALALAPADNSALDLSVLPEDHPTKGLAQAIITYAHTEPPFVLTLQSSDQSPKKVFIAENGQRRDVPLPAQIVARSWGKRHQFWTLDMNGDRVIVKGDTKRGTRAVARWVYRKWSETMNAFEDTPIAYSVDGHPHHMHTEIEEDRASVPRSLGTIRDIKISDDDHMSDNNYTYATDASVPLPDRLLRYDIVSHPSRVKGLVEELATQTFCPKPSSSTFAPQTIGPGEASMLSSSGQELPNRSVKMPLSQGRPRRAPNPTKKAEILDRIPFGKREGDGSIPNLQPKKRQRKTQTPSTNLSVVYTTPRLIPRPTDYQSPAPTAQLMTQPIHPMTILSAHKQNHTTLRVAATSGDLAATVPVLLRSCVTIDTFFTSILTAKSDKTQHGDSDSVIMVSFNWKEALDSISTIFVRRNIPDSFEVFLRTINEAPCWSDDNGSCEMEVYVVRGP